MEASIVAIGDELLIGQVTDTNSGSIARIMAPAGWKVAGVEVCGDSGDEIRSAIDRAFHRSNVVLTTGGLGPTKDDITKQVLMEIFGGEPVENSEVLENVRKIMSRRGLEMNELTAAQAIVPSSCEVIQNRLGTAPLMWFERDGKVLVAMPGVPFETVGMFTDEVFPKLQKRFPSNEVIEHRTFITTGISESALAEMLAPFEESLPENLHLAYLPNASYIRLRLDAKGVDKKTVNKDTDAACNRIRSIAGEYIVANEDITPAELLLKEADRYGATLATAESCTGGNIAGAITAIPGSSASMLGGVVSYSNSVKTNVLGVDPELIDRKGAVCEEVAMQMAAGVCRLTGSTVGIATSGIAGPGGGSAEKPVGTVCIAIAVENKCESVTMHFAGNRQRIIERAVNHSILMAVKMLRNKKEN
ncbi:MAG: CinA family nicotinamide mononucleotide deamidase-related protein [Paramuribaculum sp.]|nr:CinA family nicotinamide mononucleotide deamidase-related protein [Paramuribaculum sp.]